TAVAAGLVSSSDAATAFRVLPLQEDPQDPGAGNASVRIVHASSDAPAVAIDLGNDGSPEITSLDRFADTGAAGVPLPAGVSLAVGIWTASPLTKVTSFTTPQLPEGAELLLIAIGRVADLPRHETGFGLLAVGPDGVIGLIRQDPSIFLLHASPDAPPVDVLAGGTSAVLVGNLSFGDLSPAVQLPPAAYDLDVAPHGGGAVVASVTTPALQAGERYLAIATGFVSDTPSFTVLPLREGFASSSSALLRVVHASPDAPAVDVGVWDGTNFTALAPLSNLAFGEASDEAGVAVAAGPLSVGVAATGKTTPVAVFNLAPTAGLRTYAVACGSLTGNGAAFRLLMVDASSYPWQASAVYPN
ncbi:MAG TPA: DUF4397 domain-containing protein, partial [Candidatus Krumholzibacteria bacterium]|nr:DUF4397 domain-containing protein [Candidatus Krumholzibacteria bacterium]